MLAKNQRVAPVGDPAPGSVWVPVIWLFAAVAIALGGPGVPAAGQAGPAHWEGDLEPIASADWDRGKAGHLLERAGFGGTPDEIDRLAAMSPADAVAWLVDYARIPDGLPAFDASPIWEPGMDPFPKSRAEAVRIARETGEAMGVRVLPEGESRRLQPVVNQFFYGLRANAYETQRLALWWGDRMVRTRRPLEEKLTLFWHGHFATGNNKVRDTRMMERQHLMLRANAAGSFGDLLLGILRDPAMLVYLDNGENVKDHPNENFGRELLELFTMGVGNYTEQDIREASRAFTGWTNDVLEFRFDEARHDFGVKVFKGHRGPFDGTDIIDIILAQDATAEFIAGKLYRYFVREELSDQTALVPGRDVPRSRLRAEAAAHPHLPVPRLLQSRVLRDADQEPGAAGRLDLSQARTGRNADDSGLQPDDVPSRSSAVQPPERGGMGRRTELDHARVPARAGEPVPHRLVPGTPIRS